MANSLKTRRVLVHVRRRPEKEAAALALESLQEVLGGVPFVKWLGYQEETSDELGTERQYIVRVRLADKTRRLVVYYRTSGQPRIARGAASYLHKQASERAGTYPVFVAPFISPAAAQICVEEGIGYLDSAGNCRLVLDSIYICVDGRSNPYTVKRDLRTLYSPKAERVVRVLLTEPTRTWRVQELADAAQVSLGQVANVKALLADREWIRSTPAGLRLTQPSALLTEWSENYRFARHDRIDLFSLGQVPEIEAALAEAAIEAGVQCALTGLAAASRYAPYAQYRLVTAYVESAAAAVAIAERSKLKSVTSGPNIALLVPYDEGVFYGARPINAIGVVSPIQCFLDCLHTTSRGKEAAEYLKEQVIDRL